MVNHVVFKNPMKNWKTKQPQSQQFHNQISDKVDFHPDSLETRNSNI